MVWHAVMSLPLAPSPFKLFTVIAQFHPMCKMDIIANMTYSVILRLSTQSTIWLGNPLWNNLHMLQLVTMRDQNELRNSYWHGRLRTSFKELPDGMVGVQEAL